MAESSPYPLRVEGDLSPQLSRWLWLVKWFLLIAHFVVLVFLWVAFVALSVVALVAILITGRYPRGIFDFNLGVLRWSWRVSYYSYSALGTDAYPRSPSPTRPTTRRACRSPTPGSSHAAWRWSSGGCWRCRIT